MNDLLDKDGNEMLEELLEIKSLENGCINYDSFITGYRLATLLMVEVFQDKDSLLENREQYFRDLV